MTTFTIDPASDAAGMLRQARENAGLTLEQVSQHTNIPFEHLRAMEAGRWSDLPGLPYARAFLRTLARHLHIDEVVLLNALRRDLDLPPTTTQKVLLEPSEEPQGAAPGGLRLGPALLTLGGLLLVLGVLLFTIRRPAMPPPSPESFDEPTLGTVTAPPPLPEPPQEPAPDTPQAAPRIPDRHVALVIDAPDEATGSPWVVETIQKARLRSHLLGHTDTLLLDIRHPVLVRNRSLFPMKLLGTIQHSSLASEHFSMSLEGGLGRVTPGSPSEWRTLRDRIASGRAPAGSNVPAPAAEPDAPDATAEPNAPDRSPSPP